MELCGGFSWRYNRHGVGIGHAITGGGRDDAFSTAMDARVF